MKKLSLFNYSSTCFMIYAYIRVSTEMQTCQSQEFEIRQYCIHHGLHVDQWVTESVSGTKPVEKRTLGKLIRKMRKGDLLLCTELSRLGRNMLMVMSTLNSCSSKGIAIRSIKDHFELSDNINSKIIAFAFALAAEIERNLISQRTREALAAKKQAGIKLGRPPGKSRKYDKVKSYMSEISKMLNENVPVSIIAKKYKVHRNTMSRYIRDLQTVEFEEK